MYAEKGVNLEEAVSLIRTALELEPNNGYFIDSLGWAFYQQGRYSEALLELQRAVERAKEDPVIFDHLGDAYLKNGLEEEAVQAWEKSLSLDPAAAGVKQKIEDLKERQRRAKGERSKASQ
jgi:Flp pilus assembly protein TadD